jgi:YfiH family protein
LKNELFVRPTIFPKGVIAAQSTRLGGVSQAPYSTLNLGLYTDDNADDVLENRTRFFEALGGTTNQVCGAHQVHGTKVAVFEKAEELNGFDAFITNQKGLFLAATIADCTPILIYDKEKEAIAAVHAGWKGTIGNIVGICLDKMNEQYGTNPINCLAYIGACIAACDFEVDADVADHFAKAYKRWDEEKGKYFVDLKETNKALLMKKGLKAENIEISPYSTVTDNHLFFSHRKEKGRTGRALAVISML